MGWCIYILECVDGSLYTGCTNDLPRRVAAHRAGTAAKYTRSHAMRQLVYVETQPDRSHALQREHAIKRLSRAAKHLLLKSPHNELEK